MSRDNFSRTIPHLVWVYGESAVNSLDAATWLETSSELCKLGWFVTLVRAGPSGRQHFGDAVLVYIRKPHIYILRQVVFHIGLLRFLAMKWSDIDIVLFHQMAATWILPLRFVRFLRGTRRPLLVMDTRDCYPPGSNLRHKLLVLFEKFVHPLANQWADGQTAITQRMVDLIHIPPQQLWGIWPSGVNLADFSTAQAARSWPVTGEPIHLIYIGAMLPERKLLTLCQAVEKTNNSDMVFVLTLIGDGPTRPDLENFATHTTERIRVIMPVPHDQIPGWLAQAHIGVTSIFQTDQELFQASSPIKLFEYMAAGLPILSTRIACHTDVIGKGEYAFWVENADVSGLVATLRLIWRNRDSLSEKGHKSAIAARSWTWQESARKLNKALKNGMANFR